MAQLYRIAFTVSEEEADLLTAFLSLNVSHGWEELSLPSGETCATVHLPIKEEAEKLTVMFTASFTSGSVDSDAIEEQNWMEAWKEFFTPVECGEHFYILAPWMDEEKKATKRIPIIIEPNTAFGTGHHGSTALCLEAISALYTDKKISAATDFLDLGTGTGILGIACTKLGLKGYGLDIDPIAIQNAEINRDINGVTSQEFSLAVGTQEESQKHAPYTLVIANILAGPLKDMASTLTPQVKGAGKDGYLLLSGILVTQAQDVADSYIAQGFAQPEIRTMGEWASLLFAPQY